MLSPKSQLYTWTLVNFSYFYIINAPVLNKNLKKEREKKVFPNFCLKQDTYYWAI